MFTIDADVPEELYPLAWLVGTWRGWATLSSQPEEPLLIVESAFSVTDTTLREETTAWHTQGGDKLPVDATAEAGYQALTKTESLFSETTLWQVESIQEMAETDAATQRPIILAMLHLESVGGLYQTRTTWEGLGQGPRITLSSQRVEKQPSPAPDTAEISGFNRMYGFVMGELMWAQDTTTGASSDTDLACRLGRV